MVVVVLPAPKAQKAIKCCASAEGAMVSESRKKTKLKGGHATRVRIFFPGYSINVYI